MNYSEILRQEEKYILRSNEIAHFLSIFNAVRQYPSRTINSIYYDTKNLSNYWASEEGVVSRVKYRYRWYGNMNKVCFNGSFEEKKTFDKYKTKKIIKNNIKSLKEIDYSINKIFNGNFFKFVQVTYDRDYFISSCNNIRFTLDRNIKIKHPNSPNFLLLPEKIFEIKYMKSFSNDKFINFLGNSLTRYSKYNEAINKLYF